MKELNLGLIIKNNKGITLIALVITIIVMLILAGVTINIATNGGLFASARKAAFLQDVSKYKEELEAYKAGHWDEDEVKNKEITKIGKENIVPYIPSFDSKYNNKLKILNNELVYFGDNEKEIEWVSGIIEVKGDKAEITIKIEGQGSVNGTSEETINTWLVGTTHDLVATTGNLDVDGTNVEYEFAGWYKNSDLVSSEIAYSITVEDSATYIAKFIPKNFSLIYYKDSNNEEKIILDSNAILSQISWNTKATTDKIIKLEIGKCCTSIGSNAFNGCINLEGTINIKSGVTLGNLAFNNTGITKVIIEDNQTIPMMSFSGCTGLETVKIGDNVTIIGGNGGVDNSGTFGNCTGLKTVEMGENISIEGGCYYNYLFYGCSGLESVTIKSLSNIPRYALTGAKGALKGEIKINEGVTSIGEVAFKGCTGITKVSIPNTITSIGSNAFGGCTGLNAININMTQSKFNTNVTLGNAWNSGITAAMNYK